MSTTTTFENKCIILADLWLNYRKDSDFIDFVEYNDLGLPMAYAIAEGVVSTTEIATGFVNETFDLLLAGIGVDDTGFDNLDELLSTGGSLQ
jgi:hypothetical protein